MKIKQVDEQLSISEQINEQDVAELAKLGVKVIICNRPDGEEANQVSYQTISQTANELGLRFEYIPVSGRNIPIDVLNKFVECIDGTNQRIHAYCRTGTRCSIFWGLSLVRSETVESVIKKAQSKDIDLEKIREQLESVHANYHSFGVK